MGEGSKLGEGNRIKKTDRQTQRQTEREERERDRMNE